MSSTSMVNVLKWIPSTFWNPETQTVALTVLCFIGAWVVITRLIQFVFSILWPLIVFGGILVMAPNISLEWLAENVPVYTTSFTDWIKKSIGEFHGSNKNSS